MNDSKANLQFYDFAFLLNDKKIIKYTVTKKTLWLFH